MLVIQVLGQTPTLCIWLALAQLLPRTQHWQGSAGQLDCGNQCPYLPALLACLPGLPLPAVHGQLQLRRWLHCPHVLLLRHRQWVLHGPQQVLRGWFHVKVAPTPQI